MSIDSTPADAAGAADEPLAGRGWRHRHWFWPALLLIAGGDLASKAWVFAGDPDRWRGHPIIHPDINTGIAFSLFADFPIVVQWATLLLIVVIAWVYLWVFRHQGRLVNLAFGCVLGGAIGNGWDRLLAMLSGDPRAGVRDFISIDLNAIGIPYVWPTFNVADVGITIGFVALVLSSFFERDAGSSPKP